MCNTEDTGRLLALLDQIASSLAQIAHNTTPEAPEAPNWQRPIELYATFDWTSLAAQVVRSDEWGAALVEWEGRLWTRRAPENKFGEAIWYSRPDGKDAEGNVRYLRLITFKKLTDAEPISRAAERAVRVGAVKAAADHGNPADCGTAEREFAGLPSAGTALAAAGAAVQAKLAAMAASYNGQGREPATDDQRQRAFNNLKTLCGSSEERRHAVLRYLFGKGHTAELTAGEAQAIRDWVKVAKQGDTWLPVATAVADLKTIETAVKLVAG